MDRRCPNYNVSTASTFGSQLAGFDVLCVAIGLVANWFDTNRIGKLALDSSPSMRIALVAKPSDWMSVFVD